MKKQNIAFQKVKARNILNPEHYVLVPLAEDKEKLQAYHENQILDISVKGSISPRSVRHHRKFFTCIRTVAFNCCWFVSEKQILEWVKLKIGYIESHVIIGSTHHFKTGSISFENMEQFVFQGFFDKAISVMAEALNITDEELLSSRNEI